MRFFYIDTGMLDNASHLATYCRVITHELRKRGITPTILVSKQTSPDLCKELGATPFFERNTHWFSDGDPICGQMNAFHILAEALHKDLCTLPKLEPTDLVYVASARASQFYGLLLWLRGLRVEAMPHVVTEFANDPGLDPIPDNKFVIRDPRADPTATLYRFSACRFGNSLPDRLHIFTFETVMSGLYSFLVKHPVSTLPSLIEAMGSLHLRGQLLPLTVAVFGVQQVKKGYHLMPDVVREVSRSFPTVRFLLHNAAPENARDVQQQIRAMAANEPRIIVDERAAGPDVWKELFDATDLVVCPYHVPTYFAPPSAIALEALANGIPFIGPANSSIERLIREYQCGTLFDRFEASSVADAIQRALSNFDALATTAFNAAEKYATGHGPARTVDAILRLAHWL